MMTVCLCCSKQKQNTLLVLLLVLRAAEAQVLVPDPSGQFSGTLFSHNLFIFAK